MNQPVPTQLEKTPDRTLRITWSDDVRQEISFRTLRDKCCCAGCMKQRASSDSSAEPTGSLPILSAAEARPIDIDKMHPVGNYAYSIHFSDGHNTGIFTFEMLRLIS